MFYLFFPSLYRYRVQQYLNLLSNIKKLGLEKKDRTGVGTLSLFGHQMRFDLNQGFPLVTTKKLHIKSIVHELLWFLSGNTNIKYLNDHGVRIWDPWADADGNLGPVYGKQWRSWQGADGSSYDQLSSLIQEIKTNPSSRRLIVSAWNVGELSKMALPPCHAFFQFYVQENKLSCLLMQRSVDAFLGLPFNIASYALLTHMIAEQTDLKAHEFIWTGGDCHLYLNHLDQVDEQLSRSPYPLPTLEIKRRPKDLFSYQFDDFEIVNYVAHPHIKGSIAV